MSYSIHINNDLYELHIFTAYEQYCEPKYDKWLE